MSIIQLLLAFVGGSLFTFIIQRILLTSANKKDARKIMSYLKRKIPSEYHWLSTRNISSHTNLSQSRVEEICSKHPDIKESTGQKEGMWGLRGISDE
jgi:hypothetical protein